MHKKLDFKFDLKAVGEEGQFTGLAAAYGNVDLGGDVIEPGAFNHTLADKQGKVTLLWQHDTREPIGIANLADSRKGLQVEGELVLDVPVAKQAYALLKKGALKGLSIGYDVVKEEMRAGIRYLKEIKLYEVSLVTFPMNELATVTAVKTEVQDWSPVLESLKVFNAELKKGMF